MEAQRKEYLWAWEDLERAVRERYQETDLALIVVRTTMQKPRMKDKRYTGTPYVVHPTATAVRLAEMKPPLRLSWRTVA